MNRLFALTLALALCLLNPSLTSAQNDRKVKDAKNTKTGRVDPFEDPEFAKYAIYAATAPRAKVTESLPTRLPLSLPKEARIALIGNMLLERSQYFGYFETLLQQRYPEHRLRIRHLGWPADTATLQPRPDNFADTEQHLFHEKADVILVALGFNESFAGTDGLPQFIESTRDYIAKLQTLAFNETSAPRIVLLSPIANEDISGVAAATNNSNLKSYSDALRTIAGEQSVGFIDLYTPSLEAMKSPGDDLTINGVHLND
ncbi:MAG: SGNH/GDSL hydrolase family protein, partial [Planctomycetota bacterium]